ncbi:MAG TPA: AMP-binding protein [Solirubrobacterales bacterium]|jgi:acyl-CoA synthetase (AMP-forming)/AMP-acid ligase II
MGERGQSGSARERNLGYVLADAVMLGGDRTALVDAERRLSYAELDRLADGVAHGLADRGVAPGDAVALLWPNEAGYVVALLGVLRAGAVAVPLNPKLGDETIEYVLEDSGAVGLLAAPGELERGGALVPEGRGWVLGPDSFDPASSPFEPPALEPGAICSLAYTSGSTGLPKGVPLTHSGQIWNVDSVRSALLFDRSDVALVVTPMSHANAGVTLLVMLSAGGTTVVLPRFDPEEALLAIAEYRCTMIGGVPTIYHALLEARQGLSDLDLSSLRIGTVGSAPVPPEMPRAFREAFGAPLLEGYGLTEGGPYVLLTPRWGIAKPGSAGLPIPGCEVKAVGADGEPVAPGEVGHLWVRNPGVTPGYWHRDDLSAERLRDGWLATADLARIDEDGYVTISGRADDMLNVAGENVYPKEVEQILLDHPEVAQVFVLGIPHESKGEVPAALVVPREGAEPAAEELKQHFIAHGPAYAHPRRIVFANEMPVQPTGKPDRVLIRAMLEE